MRRRTKITIEPRHILIACAVLCIILIVVSFVYKDKMAPVKAAAGNVVAPMQKGINSIGTWISDKLDVFQSAETLNAENKELKSQLAALKSENKTLKLEKYELQRLRELYKLDQSYQDYPKVAANVIGKNPDNWNRTFTIDKGSEDGIAIDMNIIAGEGLVGIVTETGKTWATVRTIIDDKSSVGGMLLKSSDECIVSGNLQLDGLLDVSGIKKNVDVKDGYEVVTSVNSSKYLSGILVGYIHDITVDPSNLTKSGYLTPAVNLDRLESVLIITKLKEQRGNNE